MNQRFAAILITVVGLLMILALLRLCITLSVALKEIGLRKMRPSCNGSPDCCSFNCVVTLLG